MARVTIIAVKAGTFTEGILRGKPNDVSKISVVPGAFAAAGSPDYRVPVHTEALVFLTDTAIDFVVVRTNNPPTVEVAQPIPVATSGMSQYVMYLEDSDNDVFIRAMV